MKGLTLDAIKKLINTFMNPTDQFALVTFGEAVRTEIPLLTVGTDTAELITSVQHSFEKFKKPMDGTELYNGVVQGDRVLREDASGNGQYMIIITDGNWWGSRRPSGEIQPDGLAAISPERDAASGKTIKDAETAVETNPRSPWTYGIVITPSANSATWLGRIVQAKLNGHVFEAGTSKTGIENAFDDLVGEICNPRNTIR